MKTIIEKEIENDSDFESICGDISKQLNFLNNKFQVFESLTLDDMIDDRSKNFPKIAINENTASAAAATATSTTAIDMYKNKI